jgi:hypothetical protein
MPDTPEFVSLRKEIEKQKRELEKLGNDIKDLKLAFSELAELRENSSMPILGVQIVETLFEWANRDNSD